MGGAMNAREEAGKIYRALPIRATSKPIFIKGGPNRRRNVVGWLKYYGADAVSRLYIGGRWVYEFRKLRSMGAAINNPLSSKTKRRAARLAGKLAYRIWQHVKTKGYAIPLPKRTPKMVKK